MVGRDEELTRLTDLADMSVEHGARMVLLSGDAGIGKSTLTAHFLGQLRAAGWGTHVGHCIEYADRPLPFGPVVAVLRSLLLDDLERVDHLVGHHREDLAGLVPELGDGDAGSASLAGDVDRLFDAIASLLGRASEGRPIAFLIEDIHWSDAATRDLLTSLVHNLRSARVLMLVTERSGALEKGNPLRTWLAEQRRFPNVHSIELEGLGEDDLAAQVSSLTGEQADTSFVADLFQRTGGNPYFAHELVVAHGQRAGELPMSLREFLTSRLSQLGDDEREVLRAVAIAGGSVAHPVLATMLADLNLGPVIRTLFDAGILQVEDSTYHFSHALLREAILEDVLPFESEELHRAAAEALEANMGLQPDVNQIVALAIHWDRAREATNSALAAAAAASAASRLAAYETAADMGLQVLDAWETAASKTLAEAGLTRAAALLSTIDSLSLSNRGEEAISLADHALGTWVEGDHERALVQAGASLVEFGLARIDRAGERVREAQDLAGAGAVVEAAEVHLAASRLALRRGDIHEALEAANSAIRIAGSTGPPRLVAEALGTRGLGLGITAEAEDGLEVLVESRQLALRSGLPAEVARSYRNEMNVRLHRDGRSEASIRALVDGLAYAEAHCGPYNRAHLKHDLAVAYIESGEFTNAAPLVEELLATPIEAQFRLWILHTASLHSLGTGDLARCRELLDLGEEILDRSISSQESALHYRVEAELARRTGRTEVAWKAISQSLFDASSSDNISFWRDYLVEASRCLRDVRLFGGSVDEDRLRSVRRLRAAFGAAGTANDAMRALVDFELGVAAGRDDMLDGVRDVCELLTAAQFYYEASQTRLVAIQLMVADNPSDATAPIEHLVDMANSRGMAWISETCVALARSHRVPIGNSAPEPPTPERPALPHFLTDREVEVMALLAEGLTNKAIGQRLFVSPRTVSTHVSNVLAKLGVSTRGEAAAAFHRLGLEEFLAPGEPIPAIDRGST